MQATTFASAIMVEALMIATWMSAISFPDPRTLLTVRRADGLLGALAPPF
jgi:hypothetical protein